MADTDEFTGEPLDAGHEPVPAHLLELYEVLEYERLTKDKSSFPFHLARGVGPVPLVTRDQWGARAPLSVSHNITPSQGGVALHYEGPQLGVFDHARCPTIVRGIQAYHMDHNGWVDIAYSGVTCPHGYIYVGRWWGVRTAANGTNDANQNWYAFCSIIGQNDTFTDSNKRAFLYALQLASVQGAAGSGRQPHSHFFATACPGDPIRSWIASGLTDPGGTPSMPQENRKMVVVVEGSAEAGLMALYPKLFATPAQDSLRLVVPASSTTGPDPHSLGNNSFGLGTQFPNFKQYKATAPGSTRYDTLKLALAGEKVLG